MTAAAAQATRGLKDERAAFRNAGCLLAVVLVCLGGQGASALPVFPVPWGSARTPSPAGAARSSA